MTSRRRVLAVLGTGLSASVSATRRSDEMYGQDWAVGVRADDGYGFQWGTVYQDYLDLERPTPDELAVGDTIEHTHLAFPIEDEFSPQALTLTAPGPLENPPEVGGASGLDRALWRID